MRQITLRMTAVAVGILAILVAMLSHSQAQTWPQRPVRFIVPFGPGAGADIGARLLAERLPARWGGKPVVIENRPGGDGLVAIQAFLTANDDHTFLFSPSGNFTVHPFLYEKLPYTPAGPGADRTRLQHHPGRRRAGRDERARPQGLGSRAQRRSPASSTPRSCRASPSSSSTTS